MNDNEKLYHSALSRCAELLDNMPEGDPITDVPMFLAAKLDQIRAPVPRTGGVTLEELGLPALPLDLDKCPSRMSIQIKAGELAAHIRRWGNAVYLAGKSQVVQASGALTDEQIDALMIESGVMDQRWPTEKQYRAFARAAIATCLASQSQAAQPSIKTWKERFTEARVQNYEHAMEAEIADLRAYITAHLAGQSQATRAQAKSGTVQNLLHCALKELLGALPERRDWFNPDAEKVLRAVAEAGPVPAQEVTKQAVSDLHNAIMNLPANRATIACSGWTEDEIKVYKIGHRDARHAAAELVNEAEAAQEVTQQAAPGAPTAFSDLPISMAERVAILTWMAEYRKHKFLMPSEEALVCKLEAPATQQAAKAETAEQAERFFMDHGVWHDSVTGQHMWTQDQYDEAVRDARSDTPAISTAVSQSSIIGAWNDALEEVALICDRVNNHDDPMTASDCADCIRELKSNLAPTTSTVSAPEEVRNAILEEAAEKLDAMNDSSGDAAAYDQREQNIYELEREHAISDCAKAIRALKIGGQ